MLSALFSWVLSTLISGLWAWIKSKLFRSGEQQISEAASAIRTREQVNSMSDTMLDADLAKRMRDPTS